MEPVLPDQRSMVMSLRSLLTEVAIVLGIMSVMTEWGNPYERTIARITSRRLRREFRTFYAMLKIYCRRQHGTQENLCAECEELLKYAAIRLEKCPFQAQKPTCAHCPVHCYNKEMRTRTRAMMRYAGPRMLLRHPFMAVAHLLDGLRKAPKKKR